MPFYTIFKNTRRTNWLLWPLWLFLAVACGKENNIPPQQWGSIMVRLETRPSPPQQGMVEFLVIAGDSRGLPAHDLVVELNVEQGAWRQAIQDGHVGVYRRALEVATFPALIHVRLKKQGAERILEFNLPSPAIPNPSR